MPGSILGGAVKRVEDPRFLTGGGRYLDDFVVEDALWAVMVRSTVPHARLLDIDVEAAEGVPGVVGVFTAADFGGASLPIAAPNATDATRRPLVAADRVRFVGDVVAVVVAESAQAATDGAELVWPDYDLLPAVASVEQALAPGAPLVFPELGTNVVLTGGEGAEGDVLAGADVVVRLELENQRLAAVPLEMNNALARPRPDGGVEVWVGTQSVHGAQREISKTLGMDRDLVHVRVPDMGGGFGAKISAYPEQVLTVALAMELGRPVRWQERRTENMVAMSQGRAQHQVVEAGARRDGTLTGMRWRVTQDAGAYPLFGAYLPNLTRRMAAGAYRIPAIDYRWKAVLTNTTPIDAYRGAGRPEAAMAVERVMDLLAAELDLDPVEARRRNFLSPAEFPHVTATGERYDTGDYAGALDLALATVGYDDLRAEQARRRAAGDRVQLGIGISSYVEVTAPGGRKDWGKVEVVGDHVVVYSGASSHGHGHETTFAQIASQRLGVPLDRVRFVQGDTAMIATGGGTMGSRSLQMAGSAVLGAADAVFEKARRLVAHHNEAAIEDIVLLDGGRLGVAGSPESGLSVFEIAALAADPANLPPGEEAGLLAEDRWAQPEATVPFGTHISVVEVDLDSGEVRILRHVACDDCGTIFNRMIVDGQVAGGVAQGIGQALWEKVRYDDDANPLTANLTTYLIPSSTGLSMVDIAHTETPTDQNPLGAKGIGEAGTIGSGPAVVNAVHDALRLSGVRHLDTPLTPDRIWIALNS